MFHVPKNLLRDKTKGELIKRLFLGGLDVKWQLHLWIFRLKHEQLPPIDSLLRLLAYAKVFFEGLDYLVTFWYYMGVRWGNYE